MSYTLSTRPTILAGTLCAAYQDPMIQH